MEGAIMIVIGAIMGYMIAFVKYAPDGEPWEDDDV